MVKKNKTKPEIDFQDMAMKLVADKIFLAYISLRSTGFSVEPESFVDFWIENNIIKVTTIMRKAIWHYFMLNLIASKKYRKI